ncbi:ribbon-helix-helix protein, CopG family [bacterium]|nr:ribbon-helix-helix protein, CopG family [bacterium]
MKTKTKVSLTIDRELNELIEQRAQAQNVAKSQIAEQAFRLWLRFETEALMARGYEEMADEELDIAERAFSAQQELCND